MMQKYLPKKIHWNETKESYYINTCHKHVQKITRYYALNVKQTHRDRHIFYTWIIFLTTYNNKSRTKKDAHLFRTEPQLEMKCFIFSQPLSNIRSGGHFGEQAASAKLEGQERQKR